MATNYERGRAVEWRARNELAAQGYTVIRSASSKSPVDIVAVGHGMVLLLQLKRSKAPIKSLRAICNAFGEDLAKLDAIPIAECLHKELWLWVDRKGWRKVYLDPDGIASEPGASNECVNTLGFRTVPASCEAP